MLKAAKLQPSGAVSIMVMRGDPFRGRPAHHPLNILIHALPRPGLATEVNVWRIKNIPNVWRGLWRIWLAAFLGVPTHYGAVFHRVQRGKLGPWIEYGLASLRVVTDAGVADIVTRFANSTPANIANYKYHGYGTGTNNEAAGDTGLQTELTTEYVTNSTRPTGSQASSTNTYTSVATLSPDSGSNPLAITEHGLFSASSGATLLDRSKFSAVNLVPSADSLQTTYVLTLTSGG
jgi:hypothetical protein